MSLSDIKTDIRFGCTMAVSKDEINRSKVDIIRLKREHQAQELGSMIGQKKGWVMEPRGDLLTSSLHLYVSTPNELRLYLDAKIKAKLIEMSERDEVPDEFRQQLKILSERV